MLFPNYTFNHPTTLLRDCKQTQGVPLGQMFHCPKHGWELEMSDVGQATPQQTLKREPQFSVGFIGRDFLEMSHFRHHGAVGWRCEGDSFLLRHPKRPAQRQRDETGPFQDLLKGWPEVSFSWTSWQSHIFFRNSFIVIQYLNAFVSSRVFHLRHVWRCPGDELKELLGFVKETMGRWDGENYVKMMVDWFLAMIKTTRLFFWANESSSNW